MEKPLTRGLLVAAALALLIAWLALTPGGLLGKADAIGYSVCHRAPLRSFLIDGRPVPLCARCSGTFLGALLGMAFLSRWPRRAGLPDLKTWIILGSFLAAFAVDGANSFIRVLPNFPHLYESENWLRLATGTGLGLGIAAVLVPVFRQSMLRDFDETPVLSRWRDLLALLGLAALLDLAVWSENPLLLYPLALLSSLGVWTILGLVYTVLWALVTKRENRYDTFRQMRWMLLVGFTVALAQIALMDAARFQLTGTWAGFPLPR